MSICMRDLVIAIGLLLNVNGFGFSQSLSLANSVEPYAQLIPYANCVVRPDFEIELLFDWSRPWVSGTGSQLDPFLISGASTEIGAITYMTDHRSSVTNARVFGISRNTNEVGLINIYDFEFGPKLYYHIPELFKLPSSGSWIAKLTDGSLRQGSLERGIDYCIDSEKKWWQDVGLTNCVITFQNERSFKDGSFITGAIQDGRKEGTWWAFTTDGTLHRMQFRRGKLDGPWYCWRGKSTGVGNALDIYNNGNLIGRLGFTLDGEISSISWGDKYQMNVGGVVPARVRPRK